MEFPGKVKFPIYHIILPRVVIRVSFGQLSVLSTTDVNTHSSKILTIQQGVPRGVSSVGNPWGPLTTECIL